MTQPFDMVHPTLQRLMALKQTTLPLWIRVGENTARDRSAFDCAPFTCLSPSLPADGVLSRWRPHPCWFVYFVLTCTCTCSVLIRLILICHPIPSRMVEPCNRSKPLPCLRPLRRGESWPQHCNWCSTRDVQVWLPQHVLHTARSRKRRRQVK